MPYPSRLLSMLLLVLLAGTSSALLAQPQQRGRHVPAPQVERPARAHDDAPPAIVRQPPAPRQERRRERNEEALSDSVRRVERSTRGQVLSAERVPYDGRNLNRIKVVDVDGRVRIYMDDPQQAADPAAPTRGDDD